MNDFGFDPYLESPKTFHLEMPLYHSLNLTIGSIAEKVFKLICFSRTIDAYCIWCEKESVFESWEHLSGQAYSTWYHTRGFRRNEFKCSRNSSHHYFVYYLKESDRFQKIGQWPSVADFQIPQVQKYRKLLGDNRYKELTRGIGLAAHGVGIGSFVYLRRVFENLIEEAHKNAQRETEKFSNDDYVIARMDEKIKMVRDYLPEFLVENRSLYAILSKGIHDLDEDECLLYFETVKIGIEQILDEKIIQKERAEKAEKARAAIQQAHGKLNNS